MAVFEYRFPELGEGLHEGEIVKWHIKPGDEVQEDQTIMEVQNDKAVVEVPSPVTGKVSDIKVKEGTVAHVGDVVAVFDVAGEAPPPGVHGSARAEQAHESAAAVTAALAAVPSPGAAPAPAVAATGAPAAPAAPIGTPTGAAAPSAAAQAVPGAAEGAGATSGVGAAMTEKERRDLLATPGVRKLAREKGIDLRLVRGTGKGGRITREDVEGFVPGAAGAVAAAGTGADRYAAEAAGAEADRQTVTAAAPTAAADGEQLEERVPLKGVRKIIAQAMAKSVYTAPHVTVMDEVDVGQLVAFRERLKPSMEKKGVKVTYLPFVIKAVVAALKQYPALNASIDDEKSEIVYKRFYHIGIATDTDNGLMVPVIPHADRKSMWTLAADIKDLAERARNGNLSPHELKGSTFTITNIGSAGGMFFTPVINWPETAILGTGRISEKPVVKNGEIVVGSVMALSLSFDHRLIDGAAAQNAMNLIKRLLSDPELMLMEV